MLSSAFALPILEPILKGQETSPPLQTAADCLEKTFLSQCGPVHLLELLFFAWWTKVCSQGLHCFLASKFLLWKQRLRHSWKWDFYSHLFNWETFCCLPPKFSDCDGRR